MNGPCGVAVGGETVVALSRRSVTLYYKRAMQEANIDGLRYEGGPLMLDNGQLDAGNECYCDGECVAGGVANVSSCRYGAPAFVSFPHFHLADPAYRTAVGGMHPSADNHSFYIAMEPVREPNPSKLAKV